MTLDTAGVTGRVLDHIFSDHIVDEQVADRIHVIVYRIPEDDEMLVEGGSAHDVVLREAEDEDGHRKVVESWGSFGSAEKACVHALDLAETHDVVVWDDIVELR
ncbi:hypothetical protein [Natrinema ejinorense]|uniref:Uncharacterized protein n=1 Tax=Natrinema ejinorense TaxID=373386 RepID=A0A2A5QS48_9EURY|nr:hypothetical protein [Natrinema ejinorense]PCR89667.1 hypothetical protein CP557_03415 [Natrinema ejinorense]